MDEAIAWAKRLPFEAGGEPEAEGEIEIRQLFELEEFGESPAVEQGRQLERELPKEGVTASDQPSGDRRGLEVDEPVDHRRDAVAEHLAPRAEGLLLVTLTLPRFATEGTAYLPAGRPAERADPILAHAVEVGTHLGRGPPLRPPWSSAPLGGMSCPRTPP